MKTRAVKGKAGAAGKAKAQPKQQKQKKEKVQSKKIKKQKQVKKPKVEKVASVQADKKKRIKRKIEDFNKFHQEREAELAKTRKSLIKRLGLKKKLIKKAVTELQKFTDRNQEANPLLETEDGFLYIEVTLNQLPETYTMRPYQISLPSAIYSEEYFSKFCIFVRNPERDYQDKIEDLDIPCIGKVSLQVSDSFVRSLGIKSCQQNTKDMRTREIFVGSTTFSSAITRSMTSLGSP